MWVSTSPDIAKCLQVTGQSFYSHTPMTDEHSGIQEPFRAQRQRQ